jgi:hypothetical protein
MIIMTVVTAEQAHQFVPIRCQCFRRIVKDLSDACPTTGNYVSMIIH